MTTKTALPSGARNTVEVKDVQLSMFSRCFIEIGNERREAKLIGKPNGKGMVNIVFLDGKQIQLRKSHKVLTVSNAPVVPEGSKQTNEENLKVETAA